MKRWLPWLIAPIFGCALVLAARHDSPVMLQDSDTRHILNSIREEPSAWVWFVGDWPMDNHFYRPIPSLLFELDHALWPNWAGGYGLTNALLVVACVLLLFWFGLELTGMPWVAAACSLLFALWHIDSAAIGWTQLGLWWMAALLPIALLRGSRFSQIALAIFALVFAGGRIEGVQPLSGIILGWIPGRTAATMTVFALAAMACYAHWIRATCAAPGSRVSLPPPSPKRPWLWACWSLAFMALAMLSYEQAIMLPAALVGMNWIAQLRGMRPRWWPAIASWGVLGAYACARLAFVPMELSRYQHQQLRSGLSAYVDLLSYPLPGAWQLYLAWVGLGVGTGFLALLLLVPEFWGRVLVGVSDFGAYVAIWRHRDRWLCLGALGLATVIFLPMAWQKPFDHYHQLPQALYTIFVVLLCAAAFSATARAIERPAIQAPPRLDPAPGSLARP